MARKRLFGNHPDPRCETCSYGKESADGSVVLCRRGGVTAKHHSCRHYHYDPLKRTPKRQKPLDAFDAAAFSLSGLSEELPETNPRPLTSDDDEMLSRLHAYLNDNDSPDAESILDILAIPPTPKEPPAEEEPVKEVPAAVFPNAPRATAGNIPSPIIPDNTPDIFEDLKRLQIDAAASSTHAAFRGFSLKLGENLDTDEDDAIDPLDDLDGSLLALSDDDDMDDDETLEADDLILTSLGDPDEDEDVETLSINDDGSISAKTQKIADLTEY